MKLNFALDGSNVQGSNLGTQTVYPSKKRG